MLALGKFPYFHSSPGQLGAQATEAEFQAWPTRGSRAEYEMRLLHAHCVKRAWWLVQAHTHASAFTRHTCSLPCCVEVHLVVSARTFYISDQIHTTHVRLYVHARVDVIAENATQKVQHACWSEHTYGTYTVRADKLPGMIA